MRPLRLHVAPCPWCLFIAATILVKPQLHSFRFLCLTFNVPDKIRVNSAPELNLATLIHPFLFTIGSFVMSPFI